MEQFEKLEAQELQEAKEIAEMARMTPKPKATGKPKKTPPVKMSKIPDLEHMETGDIEEPYLDEVWMCAEASHTSNKVEFHVIYFSKQIMDLTGIAHG